MHGIEWHLSRSTFRVAPHIIAIVAAIFYHS